MSLPRSCASTPYHGLSRRICKNGIRFALSILLGFLRHGWRPLNDSHAGGWEDASSPRIFPSQYYSMAPTSGYSSAGCSPALPASASPDILCKRLVGRSMIVPPEIRISTFFKGLGQQTRLIKRFIVFEQGPGDDQHLGGELHPGLGLNAAFALAAIKHAMVQPAKAAIVV